MNKIKIFLIILSVLFFGCHRTEVKKLTGKDSTDIFRAVFNDKLMLKELHNYVDTLYLIKNKNLNKTEYVNSKNFKIIFIDNTAQAQMVNLGVNYPKDDRKRIEISKFNLKSDTVNIMLLEIGEQLHFEYQLKLKNNEWSIIDKVVRSGGSGIVYGFENKQWYLDLKKKVKPEPPLFPPTKLKN